MSKRTIINIIYVCLFVTVIIFCIEELSEFLGYVNIFFFKPSVTVYLFIYLFSLLPLLLLPRFLKLPSDYILLFIYFLTYIPAVVVPFFIIGTDSFNKGYILFLIIFFVCFAFLLKRNSPRKRNILLSAIKQLNSYWFNLALVFIYVVSIIIFISNFGLKFEIPSFSEIYDVRLQYREVAANSLFSAYMVGWMAYIINIFIFIKGIRKKNLLITGFAVLFQFYLFSLMALKSHIAVLILSFLIYIILNRNKLIKSSTFIKLISIGFFLFFVLDTIISTSIFQTLITRRVLIVPGQLTYFHFEFFNENVKTFWGYNVFSIFSDYSYNLPPPKLIGDFYFGRPEMTAVVNMFMEGYTAFGYFGVILVTIIFKFILNTLDSIYLHRSNQNIIMLIFSSIFAWSINSSSILTILLTHGMGVFILLFLLYPGDLRLNRKK